jgi:hypothetical protein
LATDREIEQISQPQKAPGELGRRAIRRRRKSRQRFQIISAIGRNFMRIVAFRLGLPERCMHGVARMRQQLTSLPIAALVLSLLSQWRSPVRWVPPLDRWRSPVR